MSERHYVQIDEAAAILRSRQHLRPAVEAFWHSNAAAFPDELRDLQPSAVWARQLVSWRFEDALFADMARQAKLPMLWNPYEGDRFFDGSSLKRSYVQPCVLRGYDRTGKPIFQRYKLVKPVSECCGLQLKDIVLQDHNGLTLVEWHRIQWQKFCGLGTVIDATSHKKAWGNALERDYLGLMSLFIAHGVLFEDYHGGESGDNLDSFTTDVFEPAFEAVASHFGVQPLIVQMPWWPELAYYPSAEWNTQALVSTIPRAA